MLKVIVRAFLSTMIEKLPFESVNPPTGLFFTEMLAYCSGAWVAESVIFPVMSLLWAAPNLVKEKAIINMEMDL